MKFEMPGHLCAPGRAAAASESQKWGEMREFAMDLYSK